LQQDADYPGIVPILRSEGLFERELTREEKSVRGMLVTGLTDADMFLLDIFEGDVGFLSYFEHGSIELKSLKEYQRLRIEVHPLEGFKDISAHAVNENTLQTHAPPLPSPTELSRSTEAETYVYCDVTNLEAQLWSYEEFVEQNAWKWYGDMNGDIAEDELEDELFSNPWS